MDPHSSHKLLFFTLFSLLTSNSIQAICVPRASSPTWDLSPSPNLQPVSSPGPEQVPLTSQASVPPQDDASLPPISNPLSQATFQTTPTPSAIPLVSSMLHSVPLLSQADPNLKKICQSTDYPDICLSAIAPQLGGKIDLPSIIRIAIQAASNYTKLAIDTATKLGSNPAIPPKMASTISDIKDSYSDALDNYNAALEALQKVDVGTMNSMLSAAITDFSDCDDDLAGQSSPLLDFNGKLTKMTSNCLAIVALIKQ